MSYVDRIREANRHGYAGFRPFRVAGRRVGCVRGALATRLAAWPAVFDVRPAEVVLAGALDAPGAAPAARTEAVAEVVAALARDGPIRGWRGERYAVRPLEGGPALLEIERAAVPWFGVRALAVHVNGYVRDGETLRMWVARRAADKPTHPGELDHLVAGGQPAGIGLSENVVKECAEEAGMPPALAARARPVGVVTYLHETPPGLRPDVVYCFDLELPADFRPVNRDGEVAAFELWPIERIARTVRDTTEYKFNCALVVIDFLVRHGHITPDEPGYAEIVNGLRSAPSPPPPGW